MGGRKCRLDHKIVSQLARVVCGTGVFKFVSEVVRVLPGYDSRSDRENWRFSADDAGRDGGYLRQDASETGNPLTIPPM